MHLNIKHNSVAPMEHFPPPGESFTEEEEEEEEHQTEIPTAPTTEALAESSPSPPPANPPPPKVRARPGGLKLSSSETSNPNQPKAVAWAVEEDSDEENKHPMDYVPLTPKHTDPRGSFTFPTRRLTYDFTPIKMFSQLPPTTRNNITVFLYFFLGVSLLIIALAPGVILLGRVYDPTIPVSDPSNGKLHSVAQFFGIIFLLYAGIGAMMLLANLFPSLVVINLPFKLVRAIITLSAMMCAVGAALSMEYMIQPDETFTESVDVGVEDPMLASVGATYFIGFCFLLFICLGILAHMFESIQTIRKKIHRSVNSIRYRRVYFFLAFVLFLGFTLSNFMCNPVGAGETWSGAYFRATSPYSLVNWKWTDNFVYKLFPDVMAYYLFIFVVVVFAVLAHRHPPLARWLHRRVWAPSGNLTESRWFGWHPFPYGISNGEVALLLAFSGFFVFWVVYWRIIFDYEDIKLPKISVVHVSSELAARNMGHMANLFSALTLFPASRTGLWVDVFGVPYDRCIRYHRLIGTIALVFATIHAIIWWIKWANESHLGDNIFSIDHLWISPERVSYMDWSIPIAETAWFLMLMSVISAVVLRRKLYSVFQYSHKYIGTVFYMSIVYHAWSFWYFAAGALFLWFVDKVSRGVRAARLCAPMAMGWVPRNGMVRIKLGPESYKSYKPGQYFFLNIPQLSINEWHPFTASAVTSDGIIFYIKAMPKNPSLTRIPWTQRLADLTQTADAMPMLRLSGPFGHTDFEGYESLVMFAGGIGITPMIAIFTDLMHRAKEGRPIGRLQNVALVWMSRSVAEFRLFEEIFTMVHTASVLAEEKAHVNTQACNFHVRLHCTRRESWISMVSPESLDHVRMFVAQGRCDVAGRIEEFMTANPTDTMVAVCGPHTLTHTASKASWKFGTDFHAEQFSF
eukprot:m.174936 g.174936  ORF g.174936 m.174936 type:complete len:912 (+) comp15329_c1_seq7:84-2819(+)